LRVENRAVDFVLLEREAVILASFVHLKDFVCPSLHMGHIEEQIPFVDFLIQHELVLRAADSVEDDPDTDPQPVHDLHEFLFLVFDRADLLALLRDLLFDVLHLFVLLVSGLLAGLAHLLAVLFVPLVFGDPLVDSLVLFVDLVVFVLEFVDVLVVFMVLQFQFVEFFD